MDPAKTPISAAQLWMCADQFSDLIMIAEEKEHQFRRGDDKDKSQAILQPNPTFKDRFGQSADTNPRMDMRMAPGGQNPVDGITDFQALALGLGADTLQQFLSDSCPQRELRCLR